MDFTIKQYTQLLKSLQSAGFFFHTFEEYIAKQNEAGDTNNSSLKSHPSSLIILRHDVDLLPNNSLRFARIQHEHGVKGVYYFRAVPESWDEKVIKEIHDLGHEVGYHYENLTTCNGNLEEGIKDFELNLARLRQLVPVSTICMHGSPASKWDSKDLWLEPVGSRQSAVLSRQLAVGNGDQPSFAKASEGRPKTQNSKYGTSTQNSELRTQNSELRTQNSELRTQNSYNYRDFGIIGEPYFDIDFNNMFYLTDTGRRWDGYKVSVRDKIEGHQERWNSQGLSFHSTIDIIKAAESGKLPNKIMMTFHPQRWHDSFGPWVKELVVQGAKNVVKRGLIRVKR